MHTSWFWIHNLAMVVWLLAALSVVSMALTVLAKSQKKGSERAKVMVRKLAMRASATTVRSFNRSRKTPESSPSNSPSASANKMQSRVNAENAHQETETETWGMREERV